MGAAPFGVGRRARGDRPRKTLPVGISTHMDVRRVPGVRRIDIVRAGGRHADEVGKGADEHVITGPRPRLVEEDAVICVYAGVVEEIDADKNYVRVIVSMFGRETPVELELGQAELLEE